MKKVINIYNEHKNDTDVSKDFIDKMIALPRLDYLLVSNIASVYSNNETPFNIKTDLFEETYLDPESDDVDVKKDTSFLPPSEQLPRKETLKQEDCVEINLRLNDEKISSNLDSEIVLKIKTEKNISEDIFKNKFPKEYNVDLHLETQKDKRNGIDYNTYTISFPFNIEFILLLIEDPDYRGIIKNYNEYENILNEIASQFQIKTHNDLKIDTYEENDFRGLGLGHVINDYFDLLPDDYFQKPIKNDNANMIVDGTPIKSNVKRNSEEISEEIRTIKEALFTQSDPTKQSFDNSEMEQSFDKSAGKATRKKKANKGGKKSRKGKKTRRIIIKRKHKTRKKEKSGIKLK